MLLDTRFLTYHYVPLALKGVKILITNSKVPHGLVDSEYNKRREECAKCVEYLQAKKPGKALRDYSSTDIRDSLGLIPETTRKKCLHVVDENQRVLEAEEALRKKDLVTFGKLMNRSHESLRDLYEVSCPELDWLVKRAVGNGRSVRVPPDRRGLRRLHRHPHRGGRHPAVPGAHPPVREDLRVPARAVHLQAVRRARIMENRMQRDMRILLTNDDGYRGDGIAALIRALAPRPRRLGGGAGNRKERGFSFHHVEGLHPAAPGRGQALFLPRDTRGLRAGRRPRDDAPAHRAGDLRHQPRSQPRHRHPLLRDGRRRAPGRPHGRAIRGDFPGRATAPLRFRSGRRISPRATWRTSGTLGTDDHFLNINFPPTGTRGRETRHHVSLPEDLPAKRFPPTTAPNGDIYCFMSGTPPDTHPSRARTAWSSPMDGSRYRPSTRIRATGSSIEESYRGVKFR